MAAVQLSSGAIAKAKEGAAEPITLKMTQVVKQGNGQLVCTFTDGSASLPGRFVSQVKKDLDTGKLQMREGAIFKVENYVVNAINEVQTLIVTGMQLLQQGDGKDVTEAAASDAAGGKPDQQATPSAAPRPQQQQQQQPITPAGKQQGQHTPPAAAGGARSLLTPGPTPSPSEEVKGTPAYTPSVSMQQPSFTPMSTGNTAAARPAASPIAVVERAGVTPIAALNPYSKNWCIKAKVTRKGMLRSIGRVGGPETKVFDVELLDAMGTQIQGSFWRESADKFYDSMEEGKVYYFSSFTVRPANKQYATVRNDYQINFDARTEVDEAKDQGGISTDLQLDLVPFDKLVKHIGRKAPFDVLGVVTAVGASGSIKRKSDNSDVARREVTLADQTGSSVALTLWGESATCYDLVEGSILQVAAVKATDFNGCSLSTLSRSKVTVDPDTPEAAELRSWWSSEGSSATITPLGQSLGGGAGTGGPRRNKLELLSALTPDEPLPAPDAKPTYHDVVVTVAEVLHSERRDIMYLANPANGKKVEEQEGRFWCPGDGVYVDEPEQRYMMTLRLADASGEHYASAFGDQGMQLMGCSANEAAGIRQTDPEAFNRLLSKAQWQEWSMTLQVRTREYQGERSARTTVSTCIPLDYAAEGRRLLQLIQQPQQ